MINLPCAVCKARREYLKLLSPIIRRKAYILPAVLLSLGVLAGCSSAPKKPTEISSGRMVAANQLNLANQTANQGRYEEALLILSEARRVALSTDDPELRIKTTMSRGNILFSLGRHEEAFREWESASAEGDASGLGILASLARIYSIRGELVLLANSLRDSDAAAEESKARVSQEMALVRSDPPSLAAGYITLGLAEKQLGRWAQAESAMKSSLSIHEKDLSLEDAAYDWFLIASVRSVAGNYESSLEALGAAISFDRRAENGFGLASSWQAMGEVYEKMGQAEDARAAFGRAAEIFRAIGLEESGMRN